MVKVNKITTPRDLYNKDGFVGTCDNDHEVLDVRIQIAENKLEGYYFLWNNVHIFINSNGEYENYLNGFDIIEIQLSHLLRHRLGKDTSLSKQWKDYCKIEPK